MSTPAMAGFDEVVLPGTIDVRIREQRLREVIPLAEESWRLIEEAGARGGLVV